jgi:hypothetical protein
MRKSNLNERELVVACSDEITHASAQLLPHGFLPSRRRRGLHSAKGAGCRATHHATSCVERSQIIRGFAIRRSTIPQEQWGDYVWPANGGASGRRHGPCMLLKCAAVCPCRRVLGLRTSLLQATTGPSLLRFIRMLLQKLIFLLGQELRMTIAVANLLTTSVRV